MVKHILTSGFFLLFILGAIAPPPDIVPSWKQTHGKFHHPLSEIIKRVMPSVVEVSSFRDEPKIPPSGRGFKFRGDAFEPPSRQKSQRRQGGSGFVISPDGYIVTNSHVVNNIFDGRGWIDIYFKNDEIYTASIINYDIASDIALLRINGTHPPFPYVEWGEKPVIGEPTIGIGAPLNLSFSVTSGIISAEDRFVPSAPPFVPFIQTDASINPGNSGGPLFNMHGKVIGINTLILTGQAGPGSIGLGFAIDGQYAQGIIKRLMTGEKIKRPFVGILYRPVVTRDLIHFRPGYGVYVSEVIINSPSANKLQVGDILLKMDDKDIQWRVFAKNISTKIAGSIIKFNILRNEVIVDVEIILGHRKT